MHSREAREIEFHFNDLSFLSYQIHPSIIFLILLDLLDQASTVPTVTAEGSSEMRTRTYDSVAERSVNKAKDRNPGRKKVF